MSDPVTNAEVEDVLSSIRRLVSEDKRPKSTPKPAGADRLVLTPSLRVAAPPEADPSGGVWKDEKEDRSHAFSEPQRDEQETGPTSYSSDDNKDAEETADMWSDEDAFDDDAAAAASEKRHDKGDDDAETLATDEFDWATSDEIGPVAPDLDADDEDDLPLDDRQHDARTGLDEKQKEDESAASEDTDHDEAEPEDKVAIALGAKIAALESAIGRIPDRWEPDGDDTGPYAGTEAAAPMAWEDDVELDATGSPVDDRMASRRDPEEIEDANNVSGETAAEDDGDAFGGIPFGNDDQFLDEDALRDLVSEIVRSELQGALGERITRNVRKLVRREIHRALTAQELE